MAETRNINNPFQPGNRLSVGHGAPRGNTNAMKHGYRRRTTAPLGKLPKGCSHIATLICNLRRQLEDATIETHGKLSQTAERIIQSACRHEQAALMAQRWLRLSADTMNHGERLTYITAVAAESDKRDKAITLLKLETNTDNILNAMYGSLSIADAE